MGSSPTFGTTPLARARGVDVLSRLAAVAVFGSFLVKDARAIAAIVPFLDDARLAGAAWQRLAVKLSSAAFAALALGLFVARRPSTQGAPGLLPKVVALAGTFAFPLWLDALQRHGLAAPASDPRVTAAASALLVLGYALAFVALAFLGRSFGIQAEARGLVTRGPYALVRHPLYAAETLAAAGMALHYASRPAFAALATQAALQAWRASYEEEVLERAFGEAWRGYAARTKRFVPWLV